MHTFPTDGPVTLEIRNAAGDVTVDLSTDGADGTVTVDVESAAGPAGARWDEMIGDLFRSLASGSWSDPEDSSTDPADQVRVDYDEQRHLLVVDADAHGRGLRSRTVRVTAPAGSNLRIRTAAAGVTVTGPADRAEIRSAAGDITLDEAGGSALVHTTSGTVRIGRAATDLSVRTVSGDVRIESASSGTVEVTSVSGTVDVGIAAGRTARLDLTTISGRATAGFEVSAEQPPGSDEPGAPAPLLLTVTTTASDIRVHPAA